MASYSAVLIGTNFIGGSGDVELIESNGNGTLNQLLSTVGNEKYIIDNFEIWSDDADQLQQPIELIRLPLDGNSSSRVVIPKKSRFQWQNVIKGIDSNDFPLDENTRINYNILPNATVKFTLNINKDVRRDNSLVNLLKQSGAKSIESDVFRDLGFREPDELNYKKEIAADEFMQAVGKILQPQRTKNSNTAKKLIIAGLVITAAAFVLYSISNGTATLLYSKK